MKIMQLSPIPPPLCGMHLGISQPLENGNKWRRNHKFPFPSLMDLFECKRDTTHSKWVTHLIASLSKPSMTFPNPDVNGMRCLFAFLFFSFSVKLAISRVMLQVGERKNKHKMFFLVSLVLSLNSTYKFINLTSIFLFNNKRHIFTNSTINSILIYF